MSETPNPNLSRKRCRRLRIIGGVILTLGIISAGIIYWFGVRAQDLSNNPAMLGFNKAESQQMGLLYGKSGLLIDNFLDGLKQPDTQAILILVFSALVAIICFYFARLLDDDGEPVA